ncbi:NAD(P)-dependent oxidoreductase [Actinoplanes sp. NPDC049596]|uniref:NAD-dependent epimerase/dehydratase family protein n=1 Tax=unclassified Actinoplanes TaxID=2626549 RepID=UPI0034313CBC
MKVAVTGASGFCGGEVARLAAAEGHEVVCFGRRPGPVGRHERWDATRDIPDFTGVDVVVHLAAAVGDTKRGDFHGVNVGGTQRLLAAAGDTPVVWVSSASVYRPGPYDGPVTEDHPQDGQRTAYGRTKAAGERLALRAGKVVLRPRAVYGDGDPHLLPRLRRTVRAGRAWLPGPDVPLSLTNVTNLAAACLMAHRWPAGAYNIADDVVYRRDEAVAAVLGVPVRHVPVRAARAVAALSALRRAPAVTAYGIDQVTDGLVLSIERARARGYAPVSRLW